MKSLTQQIDDVSCWVKMISEITGVLGFSLARIAYRIDSSPSSVQKIIKDFNRIPRDKMFFNLACYYHKLFYGEYRLPKAKKYVEQNQDETLCAVVIELLGRGFLDDLNKTPFNQENKKKYLEIALKKGLLGKESVSVDIGEFHRNTMSTQHTHI